VKKRSTFILTVFLVTGFFLSACSTTDHDRYDRYAKTIADMQNYLEKTNQTEAAARGKYMITVADKPFVVVRFDETGTKLKEIQLNNSIFLNQAAMQGGGAAFKQFAMAQTVQHIQQPRPYWYESLSSGFARNLPSLFGFAGLTWVGLHGMDIAAEIARDGHQANVTNVNSGNVTSNGSVNSGTAVSNSHEMDIGTGIGDRSIGVNEAAAPGTMTYTSTSTSTDTGVE